MTPCDLEVADLLPHAPPMLLLDRVVARGEQGVCTRVTVRADHPFVDVDGVPAHVGIELMAQTCGAWAGLRARQKGIPPQIGLLLGTRQFLASAAYFAIGDMLFINAQVTFLEGEMAVFDCTIQRDGALVASAVLNVFQPEDGAAFMTRLSQQ